MSSILSILSLAPLPLSSWSPHQLPAILSRTLLFCLPRPILPRFRNCSSNCSRNPLGFRGYDAAGLEEDEEEGEEGVEEEEDEDDDDEDDDEDVAADEYDDEDDDVTDLSEDDEDDVILSSWSGESKRTRIERLRGVVRELGTSIIDADELASIYNFRIDKFQRLAVEAFLRGSSVVVSAPTSSGKTLIAEAAAAATVARGRRIFYTTPLKALSNQKFRDFRETFGAENVGLLTGDSAVNKEAQVLVMTTEILRNMMYRGIGMTSSESALSAVDAVVLDEVHYLSDISRGTVWEEIVIYCPKEIQLICLSATVKNPDELAGWINEVHGKTELVTSQRRPVPLTWHFSTKVDLFPLLEEKGKRMNRRLSLNYLQLHVSRGKSHKDDTHRRRTSRNHRGYYDNDYDNRTGESLSKNDVGRIRRSLVPLVIDTVLQLKARNMLPAVWFIFNRKGCDASVQYIEGIQLLDECEKKEVELALKRFSLENPDAVREPALEGLLKGVAAHHAGCLPLWKTFIEELFQRGLIKVVFATETLAAGVNMPARTAVISSLSRRIGNGRTQLRPNELLQMAGRAGRRGIDERGHVVLIQTPTEGAEECCKLLFTGLEPLVSQFTASYGMVLNLLAGTRVTRRLNESDGMNALHSGRTLEGARKLVEQSFGTYLGSNVMIASKEELSKIEKEIEVLMAEISDEVIDRKSRQLLSAVEYREIVELQEQLRAELILRIKLRRERERERLNAIKLALHEMDSGHLPYICLRYNDSQQVERLVPAVFLGKADSINGSKLKNMIVLDDSLEVNSTFSNSVSHVDASSEEIAPCYYVALGSDNSWYLFTEKWIRTIYRTGFPNTALVQGDASPREAMWKLLDREDKQWEKLAYSEYGGLWYVEGSLETWSWSLNVPVLNSLRENDQVLHMSKSYEDAVRRYREQKLNVSRLKKKIASTTGYKEYKRIIDLKTCMEDKIRRLKARAKRLTERMNEIEPSGWKEFLSISNIVHESRALDINTQVIFPLGETAAAIRGENELWLAMVLRSRILVDLKPSQLAAVCASVVSEGIKVRPSGNNTYMYEPSPEVINVINFLEEQRVSLLRLQEKHRVHISCCLDSQFAGVVEAWASGLTWKELMMDCAMDEGDLSRLLRRTIDLLVQVPKLPDIDPVLQSNANTASNVLDRPPISDLAG